MKKTAVIVSSVLALILATYLADRITRVKPRAENAEHKSAKPESSGAGDPEPELTLKDLDGKEVSLRDLKGKVVLVNFWATWCEPCRVEIPWLIEINQKYSPKGLVILGISEDDDGMAVVAPFVAKERFDVNGQKLPMNYRILIGNEDTENKFGGLIGLPTSILISREGKQIKRITGIISYDEITRAIESQL